jgi:hypothetical protein
MGITISDKLFSIIFILYLELQIMGVYLLNNMTKTMKTIERTDEQLENLVNLTLRSLGDLSLVKDQRKLTEHEEILMSEWLTFVKKHIHVIF